MQFKNKLVLGEDGLIYNLPPMPPEKEIDGYNLPSKEQKFKKRKFLSENEFDKLSKESKKEIITRELINRSEGYWFFNNGVPTYITGSHYFYLNYWYMAAITEDGMPDYRWAQTKWFYFIDLCEKDNSCFGNIMMSGKRFSKALSLDTDIPTPDGWKKMLDIHVGDKVWGTDGKPTTVMSESDIMLNNKCFEITFSDGEKVVADAGHRWVASNAAQRSYHGSDAKKAVGGRAKGVLNKSKTVHTKIVTTQEMFDNFYGKNGYPNWSIENCKPVEYEKRDLKIPPYIMGLWIGDGSSYDTKLTNIDQFIIDEWVSYGESIGLSMKKDEDITYRLSTGNRGGKKGCNKLLTWLQEYDLIANKHVPQDYLYSSVEDRLELLRGLMDTDGHKSKRANTFHFSTKHKHLQEQVYELVVGLGMKAYRRQAFNKKYKKFYYSVLFGSYQINPFKLPRKADSVRKELGKGIRHHYRYVHKIEEIPSVPVKCIAVDNEDHTYLCTKSYIPTHNTEGALADLYNCATLIETNCLFGMQSLNATEARNNLFKGRILRSHRMIPNYLKPQSNYSIGKKEISSELTFMGSKDGDKFKDALNNVIDWRPTNASAYQGKRPRKVYIDEFGSIEEMDVDEALSTIKEQLRIGKRAFGKISLPFTLESMKPKGAPLAQKIWEESNPAIRDGNGYTISGLYRYFNPHYDGREDFIDEYGNSLIEEAKVFRSNSIAVASDGGKIKIKRQYPETVEEAFGVINTATRFEDDVIALLKEQKQNILNSSISLPKYHVHAPVNQVPTPTLSDKGSTWILEHPKPNCIYMLGVDSVATDEDTGGHEGSNIAATIIKIMDGMGGDQFMPVAIYSERPKSIQSSYEKMVALCKYYDIHNGFERIYAEANAANSAHMGNYLLSNGLKKWISMRKDLSGKGWTDQKKMFQYRTDDLKDFQYKQCNIFIRKYIHSIQMLPLIEDMLTPRNVNADILDSFLQLFTARPNFDMPAKPKSTPKPRTMLTTVWIDGYSYLKEVPI